MVDENQQDDRDDRADVPAESLGLIKVGELARRTGKSVRALRLYEELGLLNPSVRSKGGFRLYQSRAVTRIEWIQKLQDMGFSLPEIKEFLQTWEAAAVAPSAMERVRRIFDEKLTETRDTISRLTQLEMDLTESLRYLESCRSCESSHQPIQCRTCEIHGHDGHAPLLVDGMAINPRGQ